MGGLGAIEQDVQFDWLAAGDLSTELRAAAAELTTQATERESSRVAARGSWQGRFGDEFDTRVATCLSDLWRFVGSLESAATKLDELASLARAEQDRRVEARAWVASQNDDDGGMFGGVPVVGDIEQGIRDGLDSAQDFVFGEDDIPPELAPIPEPTSVALEDPGTVVNRAPDPAAPAPPTGGGGVSSANPDDLDSWASASRGMDATLTTRKGTLETAHADFQATLGWGSFDATSVIGAVGTWVSYNETDAQWVGTIAATFRETGSGVVPDAVIQSELSSAGLGDVGRAGVTYDEPIAYGLPPTSGFADDPVNTASGNFVLPEIDLPASGLCRLLTFTRTYNSRSSVEGPFGVGWGSWASVRLWASPEGAHWVGPDGQAALIPRVAGDGAAYQRVPGISGGVVPGDDGGLVLSGLADASRLVFDAAGRLVSADEGPGTLVRFGYDGDQLVSLHHEGSGRSVGLVWSADGSRVVGLQSSTGSLLTFEYDEAGRLVSVIGGPGGVRRFSLDAAGRVAAVTDADGVVAARNTYDDDGRVVAQVSAHGRRTRYRYLPGRVTVVDDDADGPVNHFVHDDHGRLVGVVDGHGNELRKTYDPWGNPTQVVERDGSTTLQSWDARGRQTRLQRPDGSWFSFDNDDLNRVLAVTASSGAVTRFAYEGAERIPVSVIDPEGGQTRLEVADGLVHRVVDPDGVTLRFGYTPGGDLASVTDELGNRALIERDAAGRVTGSVSPMGRRSTVRYDGLGRPVSRTDPGGGEWRYEWSAAGRLLAVIDPTGALRSFTYGANGEAEQITDELGHVTSRRFDVLGNLVAVVLPDGAKWDFDYDKLSRLTAINDPAGSTWLRDYDVAGRLTASVDPVGIHRRAIHDAAGRITGVDDGLTSVAFDYDELGRPTTNRRPDGTTSHAQYDRCGRVTATTDPAGGTTRSTYSPAGRLLATTTPLGHETRYEYDPAGRRSAVIDPVGHRWAYRYDGDGHITQIVAPTGESTRLRYDPGGRLAARVTSAGATTRYSYDPAGRVVEVVLPGGGVRRFTWDARGQLVAAVDPVGATTLYERDALGLLRSVVDPVGGRTSHAYDARGRLLTRTDQLGRTTAWEYDPAGRVTRRVLPTGEEVRRWYDTSGRVTAIGVGDEPRIRFTRDALGRAVVVEEPGFRHELEWDGLGRLVAKRRNGLGLTWTYDADGRRTALGYPDGTSTSYAFDPAGRLISADHPGLGDVTLTRDAMARLVERRSAWGSERWSYRDGLLTSHSAAGQTTTLSHDEAGRVATAATDDVTTAYTYDPAGRLLTAGAWSFGYDPAGRLVSESAPSGDVAYTYDAAHQLVSRQGLGETTRFTYDAAGRRTGDGDRWDWLGRLSHTGDSELAVDALGDLAEVDGMPLLWDPVAPTSQPRWLDGAKLVGDGSPWATVARDGGVAWQAHDWQGSAVPTDPWGAASSASTLGFRGELQVDHLLWLRHRAYDPTTRSFLSPDPIPSTNPYAYAANDPVNLVDPLGLHPLDEAAFASYREAAASSGVLDHIDAAWDATTAWVGDNWEYIAAGAMIVGGVVVMATGVGGPIGAAMIGGALLGGGISTGSQMALTGQVNWRQVGIDAALGAAGGGAGAWAGGASAAWSTTARVGTQIAVNTGVDVTGGMANRALTGQNPFDPTAIAIDTLTGTATGSLDAGFSLRGAGGIDPPPVDPTPPSSRLPDDSIVVRGGQSDLPPPGEVFSGAYGETLEEAAAGVPHGTIRQSTAGGIYESGGTVEVAPELTRSGTMNERHVNVTLGEGDNPFGPMEPNPVPKRERIQ